jgi:hypothetical protein
MWRFFTLGQDMEQGMQQNNSGQTGKFTAFGRLLAVTSLCGFFIVGCGGGSGDDTTDTTVVEDSSRFIGDYYSGSGNCSFCHDALTDGVNDISIVSAWSSSMMANATRDPYWQAKVASELKRTPLQDGLINDACSRCHAPMAHDSAIKDGEVPEIFGQGFLNPANAYFDHAADGVSCTLCHQIEDINLGQPEGTSGGFVVAEYTDPVDRPAYGEYSYPIEWPMQNDVAFTPKLGTHTGTSEMCASCHDLKTPTFDAAGEETGNYFPEQMVFTEWQNGTQEQTCQDCHMPELDDAVKISNRPVWLADRAGFSTHDMLGANTVMLEILDSNRVELGVTAQGFDQAIMRNRAFLETAATIEILSSGLANGELTLDLKITNLTGHKLPTAYPSRRMFIHLVVEDDNGTVLFESGKMSVDNDGSVVGINLDEDPERMDYEPHHDVITEQSQVQSYEPIMMDSDGAVTHTLLRAAGYVKDNRLLPSGFDKDNVSDDVQVAGAAMLDDDFIGGSDVVTYRISDIGSTNLTVTAELQYQALSYGHLQNLFEDNELEQVDRFQRMYE